MRNTKLCVGVILFVIRIESTFAAFDCPPMPDAITKVNRDIKSDISASAGSLAKIKVGELGIKTEIAAKNLFEKYPNVDKLLALQSMSSTYCQMLRDNRSVSETDKLNRWEGFQDKVLDLQPKKRKDASRSTPPVSRAPSPSKNEQHTHGPQSPAVSDVHGNVTISIDGKNDQKK